MRVYSKKWLAVAGVLMGLMQLAIGAFLITNADGMALVLAIGVVGILSGFHLFYLAYFTRTTPIVVLDGEQLEVRGGPLHKAARVALGDIVRVDDDPRSYLCVYPREGRVVRIPRTAIQRAEGDRLAAALQARCA